MVLRSRLTLWQRIAYSWWTLLILLTVVVVSARGTWHMYHKSKLARERVQEVSAELAAVKARKGDIQHDLQYVKTTAGIESELRHKFDVAREGEHLLVIVDAEVEGDQAVTDAGFWDRILQHLPW